MYTDIDGYIKIENPSDFDNVKLISNLSKIKYVCVNCGKNVKVDSYRSNRLDRYKSLLCRNCHAKKYNNEIYGCDWPIDRPENKKKSLERIIEIRGKRLVDGILDITTLEDLSNVSYGQKIKYICKKCKNISVINYTGTSSPIMKYGLLCRNCGSKYIKNIIYGNPNFHNIEKAKLTKKKRYGDENYNNREKSNLTCFKHNGYINPFCDPKNRSSRYRYENDLFHSGWELALWIYAKDHNEEIIREPCYFEFEYNHKTNKYYPDFKYKGKLIEIKGNYFYKDHDPSKRMIYPYSRLSRKSKPFTPKEKQYMDDLYEAKHQCGLKNGVEFWNKKEMEPYMEYIDSKYGSSYIAQFKISS